MTAAGPRRISGLQRSVFKMYKRSLRMVQSKPMETRSHWFQFVSHQFRSQALGGGVTRRDTATIEYLLRRGQKALEQYESPGVRNVVLPQSDRWWEEGWVARGGKEVLSRKEGTGEEREITKEQEAR